MRSIIQMAASAVALLVLIACGEGKPAEVPAQAAEQTVVVFAAASLTDVMHEIGARYAAKGHPEPKFSFAGSSALARQIEQGAAAEHDPQCEARPDRAGAVIPQGSQSRAGS